MIGMFWAEKYAMVTGLTLVVRAMFRPKGTKEMWVCALTAGAALISMNLGAGLLYPYSKEQYIFGIAEGIFAGSSMIVLWILLRKLLRKKPAAAERENSPGEDRISHYTQAFTDLAKTFLSVPSGRKLAVVGWTIMKRSMRPGTPEWTSTGWQWQPSLQKFQRSWKVPYGELTTQRKIRLWRGS